MTHLLSILLFTLAELLAGEKIIDLTFVGDAMQHGPQISSARQADGSYDYSQCFTYIEPDIAGAHFALANLECTLGGKPYSGYPCFSAPDEYAAQLQRSGFDFLVTANNHCLDRRDAGAKRTIRQLDSIGMPHAGTYLNDAHRDSICPHIVDINGMKMAVLSYTYGTNGIPVQGDVVVDYIDRNKIADDIRKARHAHAHLICVCMHWGVEYMLLPDKSQKDLADFLVSQGVDLIIGSHPHVIQPMEMRVNPHNGKRSLLVYSLGNFISNQNSQDSRGGAMVKVKVSYDIYGNAQVRSAAYKLFFCQKPADADGCYQLIPEERDDLVRNDSKRAFSAFVTRAKDILSRHNINVPQHQTPQPTPADTIPLLPTQNILKAQPQQ